MAMAVGLASCGAIRRSRRHAAAWLRRPKATPIRQVKNECGIVTEWRFPPGGHIRLRRYRSRVLTGSGAAARAA